MSSVLSVPPIVKASEENLYEKIPAKETLPNRENHIQKIASAISSNLFIRPNEQSKCYMLDLTGNLIALKSNYYRDPDLIKIFDNKNRTLMHYCAWRGDVEAMKWLDSRGCELYYQTDDFLRPPLYFAIKHRQIEAVKWLYFKMDCPALAMQLAVKFNFVEAILWLHEQNPEHIQQGCQDELTTPMEMLLEDDNFEVIRLLFAQDDNVLQGMNSSGETAMHIAVRLEKENAIHFLHGLYQSLIHISGNGNQGEIGTAMHQAVQCNFLSGIPLLHSLDDQLIHKRRSDGYTPMHLAGHMNNVQAIEALDSLDSNLINAKCADGSTVMHFAVVLGGVETMEWLDKKNPQLIHTPRKDGCLPVHFAANYNQLEAVQYLYKQDKNMIKIGSNGGFTAMHFAAYADSLELVEWLNEQDPTLIHAKTQSGETPLMQAKPRVKQYLLSLPSQKDLKADSATQASPTTSSISSPEAAIFDVEFKDWVLIQNKNAGEDKGESITTPIDAIV